MVWQIHLCGLNIPTKYSYKLYNHCQAYLQLHQYWTSCWKVCICPCWCVWLYVWLHLSAYWRRRAAHGAGYNHDCCSHPETYTYTNTLQYNFCTNLEWAYNYCLLLNELTIIGRNRCTRADKCWAKQSKAALLRGHTQIPFQSTCRYYFFTESYSINLNR